MIEDLRETPIQRPVSPNSKSQNEEYEDEGLEDLQLQLNTIFKAKKAAKDHMNTSISTKGTGGTEDKSVCFDFSFSKKSKMEGMFGEIEDDCWETMALNDSLRDISYLGEDWKGDISSLTFEPNEDGEDNSEQVLEQREVSEIDESSLNINGAAPEELQMLESCHLSKSLCKKSLSPIISKKKVAEGLSPSLSSKYKTAIDFYSDINPKETQAQLESKKAINTNTIEEKWRLLDLERKQAAEKLVEEKEV